MLSYIYNAMRRPQIAKIHLFQVNIQLFSLLSHFTTAGLSGLLKRLE